MINNHLMKKIVFACILLLIFSPFIFKEEPIYVSGRTDYSISFIKEKIESSEYPIYRTDITLSRLYESDNDNYLGINLIIKDVPFRQIQSFEFKKGIIQIGDKNIIMNKNIVNIYISERDEWIRVVQDINNKELLNKIIENENNEEAVLYLEYNIIVNNENMYIEDIQNYNVKILEEKYLKNINPKFPNIFNYIYWAITFASV